MKLSDWVAREGKGALTRLHNSSGKTFATVSRVVRGAHVPDVATAVALSNATGGECSVAEIIDEALAKVAASKGAA